MTTSRWLHPDDVTAYCAQRVEAIVESPWAFLGAPGDDGASDPAVMRQRLGDDAQNVCGTCTTDNLLVAIAGMYRQRRVKVAHRAVV